MIDDQYFGSLPFEVYWKCAKQYSMDRLLKVGLLTLS